jgi:superfamily II DNA or RNA helicase
MLGTALSIGASAVYYNLPELRRKFTLTDRYEVPYQLFRVPSEDPSVIHVPRTLADSTAKDHRDLGLPIVVQDNFVPRTEEQARIVEEAWGRVQGGQSFIIQSPTGSGKTYVGSTLIAKLKRRALVIVTKDDIVDQWRKAIHAVMGIPIADIPCWRADNPPPSDAPVVLGMVHSVSKGPDRYSPEVFRGFGIVVCDEVHRMAADQFSQAMWWLPAKIRIGLSATPYRKDGRQSTFLQHIGPIAVIGTQEVLIPKVLVRQTGWKQQLVWRNGGFTRVWQAPGKMGAVVKQMSKDPDRNAIITEFVVAAVKAGRSTILFSDSIEHLIRLQSDFVSAGISPHKLGYYTGLDSGVYEGPVAERRKMREAVKLLPVILATYNMASEATDIPWLDTAVLATPRSDVVQIVGRIRREHEGKKPPLVLDLMDENVSIFAAYAEKRLRWYRSLGAEIKLVS